MANPTPAFNVAKQLGQTNEKFIIFYFLWVGGICSCVWFGIMNSFDYFATKFPNDRVTFIFPIPITIAQLLVTVTITHLSKIVSYSTRIFFTLAAMVVFAFVIPFEADIFATTEQWSFGMCVIILLIFLLGIVNNACFASILAFASQINGKYSANALIGIGLFGLILNFLKEGVIYVFNGHEAGALFPVMFYFALVAGLAVIGVFLHFLFIKTDFYKNIIEESDAASATTSDTLADREALLNPSEEMPGQPVEKSFKTLFEIFNKARLECILVFIYNLQLGLAYPGLVLKKPVPFDDATKNVSMIMTFNLLFLCGKILGQYRNRYNKSHVIIGALARFGMIVLFIIQAVTMSIPVLNTVWFGYFVIGCFGLTIGFGNVAFFFMIPEQVDKPRKEIAGFLTVIGINIGNLAGTLLALPLQNIGMK